MLIPVQQPSVSGYLYYVPASEHYSYVAQASTSAWAVLGGGTPMRLLPVSTFLCALTPLHEPGGHPLSGAFLCRVVRTLDRLEAHQKSLRDP